MAERLRALLNRVDEARRLGANARDAAGYLAAHYWARLSTHAPFELPRFTVPVKVRANGAELCAYVRSNNSDWGVLRGIFLEEEYALRPRPANIRRILDLGGNCGYASLYFAACYPDAEIVSLEPMPENARIARSNFEANGVRGEVIQAAVAREDGHADLLLTDNESCQSLVGVHAWNDKLRVETLSVPSLMKRKGWDGVDLFKIDIEGYEKLLFQDSPAWLEQVGIIVGELHGDYGQAELQRDLAPFGFEVSTLSRGFETTFVARRD